MKNLTEYNSHLSKGDNHMSDMDTTHSINSEDLSFQKRVLSHEQEQVFNWTTSVSDSIDEILAACEVMGTKGKTVASSIYSNRVFSIADTSEELKNKGLKGTTFTIKYTTISRHFKKDRYHLLRESEWRLLPIALSKADLIVLPYRDKSKNGYRIRTDIIRDNKVLIVGVSVKKGRHGAYFNDVKTLFFQ